MFAMAQYFDWSSHRMMTEFDIDGSKADLVFISKSGYATEIEIKVTLADWNADQKKYHWTKERKYIARFFYAVPEQLADRVPEWVPPHVGIIAVFERAAGAYDGVRIVRDAKRMKCEKVPQQLIDRLVANCYYRYWRVQMQTMLQQLGKQRRERDNGNAGN